MSCGLHNPKSTISVGAGFLDHSILLNEKKSQKYSVEIGLGRKISVEIYFLLVGDERSISINELVKNWELNADPKAPYVTRESNSNHATTDRDSGGEDYDDDKVSNSSPSN